MKRTSQFFLFAMLVFLMSFIACKKDDNKADETPSPAARNNISGIVISDNSLPIEGASVTVDGKSTTTDVNGKYFIDGLSGSSKYQIEVIADGFFNGYKNVENIDGANCEIYADVMIIAKQELPQTISAQTGGTIVSPNNDISYFIDPNAFNLNGVLYDGQVKVRTNYIDASDQSLIAQAMPGGDFAAVDSEGNDGGLISFGFLATEFVTPQGQVLTVNPNTVQAGISVPSQVPNPGVIDASAWIFNPTNGNWSSAGDVTNVDDMWFLPVTSQLFCNLDQFSGVKELTGRVIDCEGNGEGNVDVTVSSSRATYSTKTNGNGYYRVPVAVPSEYEIQVDDLTLNTGWLSGEDPIIVDNIQLPCPEEDPAQQGTGTATFLGVQYTGNVTCDSESLNGRCESRINTAEGYYFYVSYPCGFNGTASLDVGSDFYASLSLGELHNSISGTLTRNGNIIEVSAQMYNVFEYEPWNPGTNQFYPFTMTINCQ